MKACLLYGFLKGIKMSKIKNKLKNYIGTKAFYKTAFAIIIPVVVQQLILSVAGFIDNFMINGYSVNAYAGVSTANRFMFIINFFWIGLTAAISIFVSQYYGAKDRKNIIGTFQLGLLLAVVIGIISTFVIIFAGPLLIKSFLPLNEPDQIASVKFGIDYVTVIGYGAIFFLLPFMISVFFRATGRPKVPLIAGIIGIIVNISFNYILIYGHFGFPEMGATGAALATVISKIVELVVLIIFAIFFSNEKYTNEIFKKPIITGRLVSMYFKKERRLSLMKCYGHLGWCCLLNTLQVEFMNGLQHMVIHKLQQKFSLFIMQVWGPHLES